MGGGLDCKVVNFTTIERFHGAIMYSRPNGNTNPDIDPSDFGYADSRGSERAVP